LFHFGSDKPPLFIPLSTGGKVTSAETLAAALALLAAGFSIIPLSPGSKLPAIKWKPYETLRPVIAQLEAWFSKGHNNIGLMMGAISGNAIALDFDDPELARLLDLEELATETLVQETPRGFHIIVRTAGEPMRTTTHSPHGLAMDLKAEKSYVVAAPSSLSSGGSYRLLSPDLRIATVDRREVDAFIARLEAEWPTVRIPCLRIGRQGALDDFVEGRSRRSAVLRLASIRRGGE